RRRSFLQTRLGAAFAPLLLPRRALAAGGVTVLRAARLFDGMTMRMPGVVVIKDDRIVSMTAGDAGSGASLVDLGDATLMPGMIDCHTHLAARGFDVDLPRRIRPGRRIVVERRGVCNLEHQNA